MPTIRFVAAALALLLTTLSPLTRAAAQGTGEVSTSPAGARGLVGAYDEQNPFAKSLRGELETAKVYEDERVLVFLSNGAVSRGHALVISKTSKARNVLEMDPDEYGRLMAVARRVAFAQRAAFKADGMTISQNNGEAAGQSVFHLHIHVVPRYAGQPLQPSRNPPATVAELTPIARELAAALKVP
ncbi:HIT family protein [Gemmatimonas sp.]|uniref:HIT family protein n=1 Tax=Gemmatimonas sp. TaxID=1962908 RepID=UPI003F707116